MIVRPSIPAASVRRSGDGAPPRSSLERAADRGATRGCMVGC